MGFGRLGFDSPGYQLAKDCTSYNMETPACIRDMQSFVGLVVAISSTSSQLLRTQCQGLQLTSPVYPSGEGPEVEKVVKAHSLALEIRKLSELVGLPYQGLEEDCILRLLNAYGARLCAAYEVEMKGHYTAFINAKTADHTKWLNALQFAMWRHLETLMFLLSACTNDSQLDSLFTELQKKHWTQVQVLDFLGVFRRFDEFGHSVQHLVVWGLSNSSAKLPSLFLEILVRGNSVFIPHHPLDKTTTSILESFLLTEPVRTLYEFLMDSEDISTSHKSAVNKFVHSVFVSYNLEMTLGGQSLYLPGEALIRPPGSRLQHLNASYICYVSLPLFFEHVASQRAQIISIEDRQRGTADLMGRMFGRQEWIRDSAGRLLMALVHNEKKYSEFSELFLELNEGIATKQEAFVQLPLRANAVRAQFLGLG